MSTSTDPATPWDSHFDLITSARSIGRFVSIERQLFAVVGQWVQSETDTAAKLHFAQQCYHHHWHAELLTTLLPTPVEQYPAAYIDDDDPHTPGHIRAASDNLVKLGGLANQTASSTRLAGLYGVILPDLAACYQAHFRHTVPQTDGPTRRVLSLILTDLATDLALGKALLSAVPQP
jgi:hypothetical protein